MVCDTNPPLLIDTVMRSHPLIRDSATVAGPDNRYVTFLVPEVVAPGSAEISADLPETWRRVWNLTYSGAEINPQRNQNFGGWNSSYTGRAIPAHEMRQWVRESVASVTATGARTYLEIGCGTGLLLQKIAPVSDFYLGVDLAETAVRYVAGTIGSQPFADRVKLAVGAADEVTDLAGHHRFECVIINSVAQYFPDEDYLTRTIRQAISITAAGGFIFVGDVRHKGLGDAFYASILGQTGLRSAGLDTLIRTRAAEEQELLIDPGYFTKLRQQEPAITGVQMSLKKDGPDNELTWFRYDVLLQVNGPDPPKAPDRRIYWGHDVNSVSGLEEALASSAEEFVLDGVPNSRITPFTSLLTPDEHDPPTRPEEIWRVAARHGWQAHLDWSAHHHGSRQRHAGRIRALFHRRGGPAVGGALIADSRPPVIEPVTSCPRHAELIRAAAMSARSWARARLPPDLVPATIRVLPELPTTRDGHADCDALRAAASAASAEGWR
jgi:SAM-dependent methyltransferase